MKIFTEQGQVVKIAKQAVEIARLVAEMAKLLSG